MRRFRLVIATVAVMFSAAGTWAQQSNPPPPNADPMAMWNVQQMVDRATSQVVKRYTLTPEQEDFTRKLMVTRVNAFLDKHEQEIRDIFTQAMRYQLSGNPPPADKVKEWTTQLTPMFDEAKVQILQGNQDFREILSDDQQKVHDIDLKTMENNFKDAQERLTRWQAGGYNPDTDFGPRKPKSAAPSQPAAQPQPAPEAPQAAPAAPATPPTPVAPTPEPAPSTPGRVVGSNVGSIERSADIWEMYVHKFIDNYRLDPNQSNLAMQILADTKKRADEYLTSRKDEYERLQTQMASAAGDQKTVADISERIRELNKPVQVDLFNEMKMRLDQIPTEPQRKAFAESQPKKATASAPASRSATASRPTTTSRPAVASRPAPRRSPATRPASISRTAASQPAAQR